MKKKRNTIKQSNTTAKPNVKVSNNAAKVLALLVLMITGIGRFFAFLLRAMAALWKKIRNKLCENKKFARFVYVTLPYKTKNIRKFLWKYRYKITVPILTFLVTISVLVCVTEKETVDSDYQPVGDESVDFGMVLQNYNTFNHIEETHIGIALSWEDGALNLNGGRAAARIKAKVYPINLENREIEWSSSDTEIASIDKDGRILATAPGSVEITARLVNHNKAAKAKLSVKQPVTGIFLPTTTMTLYMGGGARYLNSRIFPENASNTNIKWTSKDTKVARVDNNGTVKPVGIGMTEITAVTEDGGFTGSCFVTVVNPSVDVDAITLQNAQDMSIKVGDNINAIVTVSPANARNKTLKWFSDNESVATVSQTGRIHGVAEGTASISARSVNGKTLGFMIEVKNSDDKDPFILADLEDIGDIGDAPQLGGEGRTTYTSYNVTFPQALRIQMSQNPPPQKWTSGGNVNASETETAEYMNPNNYYTDAYKYQFLDLSRPNGISVESLNAYLADKGVLRGMGSVFIAAARRYSVSEVYLAAHACLESGNGTSQLARGVEVNGVTVYNLFGIAAYDNSAVYSGSQKAYKEGWTSVEKAIMGGVEWISRYYINSADGRQNTLYKMLWNPENPGYHQYATDIGWAVKQAISIERIFSSFPSAARSFDIPVYSGQLAPDINDTGGRRAEPLPEPESEPQEEQEPWYEEAYDEPDENEEEQENTEDRINDDSEGDTEQEDTAGGADDENTPADASAAYEIDG